MSQSDEQAPELDAETKAREDVELERVIEEATKKSGSPKAAEAGLPGTNTGRIHELLPELAARPG